MTAPEITIAYGSVETARAAAMTVEYTQRAIGKNVHIKMLPGLAGPNEVIQVITDSAGWHYLIEIGKPVFNAAVALATKEAYERYKAWKNSSKPASVAEPADDAFALGSMLKTLEKAKVDGNTIIFALPIDKGSLKGRNVGVELKSVSEDTFLQSAVVLATIGDGLIAALNQYSFKEAVVENSDCSCAITVNPDGSAEVEIYVDSKMTTVRLKFDALGKRVETST
ncbi:hypothetical protein NKH54_22655 [Mesorhizobium sp. M1004]|uniref:hypothetical protein n=1 Tax=Mesorhizobium sp. M1004 TaxID=2957046 RepID=UPI00333AF2A5